MLYDNKKKDRNKQQLKIKSTKFCEGTVSQPKKAQTILKKNN